MNNCTINDKWTYNNMKVVFLENKFLKIGVLAGRGSDIFQFVYKPTQTDLMLKLDKDILNPHEISTQMRDTKNQFEDYYYGGWQEILPNTPAIEHRGVSLGQHGEVSLNPWDYAIVNNSDDEVSLKLWTRPLRYPILIEKMLTLKKDEARLYIDETLTNESETKLRLMWGHHIAFGLPFVGDGAKIETSATKFIADGAAPSKNHYVKKEMQDWPMVKTVNGSKIDASVITKSDTDKFSDMAFLSDFKDEAYYKISNNNMSFSVYWDKNIFKNLWYWQERYGMQDAPWWGKAYAIALEPWTNMWSPNPDKGIMERDWLKLEPREVLKTSLYTDCSH